MLEHLTSELHDFALLHGVVIGKPPPGPHVPSRVGNFDLVVKHRLNVPPFTTIAKWRSRESGLTVYWADTPGPIAKFWATVVSEIFDSSGEPHTLEHLTFTASKHYKYSGILDALANRMFTSGSNAATDTDNTTYTLESCSERGLLTVIPVYLDHILFPVTDESIFKTEVYHVDGKGEEGGVVFSEMQGREGSQGDVMDRALAETLYNTRNAYRSETGGQLDALRKLTLTDITNFHQKAYAPQNLTVVVTGQSINPVNLLNTLQRTVEINLEREGLAKGPRPRGWIRPLVESSTARNRPVIKQDIVKTVKYAEADESVGTIQISWVGPPAHDWLTCMALEALATYLAGNSTAPLSKQFCETANPACSGIEFDIEFRNPTVLTVTLSSVPADQLPHLGADFLNALEHLPHEKINMNRMWGQLKTKWLKLLRTLETDADEVIRGTLMQDILYGAEDGKDLPGAFSDLKLLRKLMLWTPTDWLNLLKTWYVKPHNVTLIGTPSAELVEQNERENKARVSATKKRLGKAGLAALADQLDKAKEANEHPAPASIIEAFKIPGDDIAWLKVETARSNGVGRGKETYHNAVQDKINRDGGGTLPYFVQFDHYQSNFIAVSVFLHGPPLPIYPLWDESFFSMPIRQHDGTLLTFEKASRKLNKISIGKGADTCEEGFLITIRVVKKDYAKAIRWLSDVIYGTQYDIERLHNLVNSAVENLPSMKEDGSSMAIAALETMFFSDGSFMGASTNGLKLAKIWPELQKRLATDPQSVIKDLEDMRHAMVDPRALRMSVRGDVLGLAHPVKDWLTHFEHVPSFPPSQLVPVPLTRDLLTPLGMKPSKKGIIITVPTSESTYLYSRSTVPAWTHPDYFAIELATALLSASNGPLWKACRGPGLCYGADIGVVSEWGNLSLGIYKAPDAFAAFIAAKKVVEDIVKGKMRIAQSDVDAARSSVVFSRVSALNTTAEAYASFVDTVVHSLPSDYNQRSLQRIKAVTAADVERVVRDWILPLFQPEKSILGASANAKKAQELAADLTEMGYSIEQREA